MINEIPHVSPPGLYIAPLKKLGYCRDSLSDDIPASGWSQSFFSTTIRSFEIHETLWVHLIYPQIPFHLILVSWNRPVYGSVRIPTNTCLHTSINEGRIRVCSTNFNHVPYYLRCSVTAACVSSIQTIVDWPTASTYATRPANNSNPRQCAPNPDDRAGENVCQKNLLALSL